MLTTSPTRLGELVMLHRLAVEESETESISTQNSSLSDLDKLDLNSDRPSSMSTVFSDTQSASSLSKRSSSPARSGSPSRHKPALHNPFRRTGSGSSSDQEKKKEDGLALWLRDGNVIYKSVGLGLMDLVVGTHLITLAKHKQIGTVVGDF